MDVLKDKSTEELVQSLICEVAKAKNELSCSKADTEKATSRLNFSLVLLNEIINRKGD